MKDRKQASGTKPAPRPCALCGGALRFSHRERARGGADVVVLRCRGCGATVSHAASGDSDDRSRPRSRKPPVDEGPPQNRVLDPELARRLLESMAQDGPVSS